MKFKRISITVRSIKVTLEEVTISPITMIGVGVAVIFVILSKVS